MSSVARIKLPVKGIDQKTEDLLLWKDVKKTGLAFGGVGLIVVYVKSMSGFVWLVVINTVTLSSSVGATALFLLLSTFKNNMLSLLTMGAGVSILVMLAWSVVGGLHFVNKPPPPMPKFMVEGIAEADIRSAVERVTPYVNKMLFFAHRIFSGKDVVTSLCVGFGLYFLSKVFAAVSLLGLAYSAVVLVFSVPKVYEMYHVQIDEVVNMFRQKATILYDAYFSKALKMIPKAQTVTPAESSSARKED